MSVIGVSLQSDQLVLTKGRDFKWAFQNLDAGGNAEDFPPGDLYFEFALLDESDELVRWDFTIDGDLAEIKVESVGVDAIPARTKWQLVFLAEGEAAGGDPVAIGQVRTQGA